MIKKFYVLWVPLILLLAGCPRQHPPTTSGKGSPTEGVKSARFQAHHEFKIQIPGGSKKVRAWFVLPLEEPAQTLEKLEIRSSVKASKEEKTVDSSTGNRYLYLEFENPKEKEISVSTDFLLTRREVKNHIDSKKTRSYTEEELKKYASDLKPSQFVVINEKIEKLAGEITGDEKNPLLMARKIYDWTLKNVDYWVKDPEHKKASPVGDTMYCLNSKTGNCTDFHSLWASLAKAKKIPTRIVYGTLFKPSLDGKDIDQSYHCWIEFYAPQIGWIPLDVAIADIFVGDFTLSNSNRSKVELTTATGYEKGDPKMVEYYFGNLEERRVAFSIGRDLALVPQQKGGPINSMPKGYVEVDGKEHKDWSRKFTYKELK